MKSFRMGRVPALTFGAGTRKTLPDLIADLGGDRVLVIADQALAGLGVTDQVEADLAAAGLDCRMAADVAGEPKEALIDTLSAQARHQGATCVVGLGGGAAMDAAKLVAAIAPAGTAAAAYALDAQPFPTDGVPAIAIPTTAGTGSEVTRTAIVSTDDGVKNWYWGEELLFAHAILDPELTLSLPAHLTAWTGIDAVAHALEASTAKSTNAAGLLYGLEALRILAEALPQAVRKGDDLAARGRVLWGATVAGLALHNCNTHMGHNMSHALGSLCRIHHGLATGLALEASLPALVARSEGADHYALAAEALGGEARAQALPEAFARLMRAVQIEAKLPSACAGVQTADLAAAMASPANFSMSQNAACPLELADLDAMATRLMAFPLDSKNQAGHV